MSFDIARFAALRPHLYHLTAAENVARIRAAGKIESAAELMHVAGDLTYLRQKRHGHIRLEVDGAVVVIRDQSPLYEGNIDLQGGWSFEDVIESLNERVFFWPGGLTGPNDYGERHFERYRDEDPAIVRVNTALVVGSSENAEPEFCKYNSGSPRCSGGNRSPRGPETFVNAAQATFLASQVVEVTFPQGVLLPPGSVEYCRLSSWGDWQAV